MTTTLMCPNCNQPIGRLIFARGSITGQRVTPPSKLVTDWLNDHPWRGCRAAGDLYMDFTAKVPFAENMSRKAFGLSLARAGLTSGRSQNQRFWTRQ